MNEARAAEGIAPHSEQAERAGLGAAMQSDAAAAALVKTLRPSDYYHDKNGAIHAAIESVLLTGGHVDVLTVGHVLQERGQLQEIGCAFLAALVDEVPAPSHYPDYIRIVKQKATARRVTDVLSKAVARIRTNGKDPGAEVAALWDRLRDVQPEAAEQLPTLEAPVSILRQAKSQGEPISTGIPPLDERLRGGMRPGKALVIGGTAGAGKTALGLQVVKAGAEQGCAVCCLMADEGREPAIIRLGQQLGYARDLLEAGHEPTLAALEKDLAGIIIRFPNPDEDGDTTIEGVAEALVRDFPKQPKVFLVDSIQTVRTRRSGEGGTSIRERIMENARTARRLAVEHNLVVIYTSEVNRSWYRARKEEDRSTDLAAFAEARIEFSGDVLLTMRASDEEPDLVDVHLAKNRLGGRAPFLLRLDRQRALFGVVDGEDDSGALARDAAHRKAVDETVERILRALKKTPDLTRTQLLDVVGRKTAIFSEALEQARKAELVTWQKQGVRVLYRLAEVPK